MGFKKEGKAKFSKGKPFGARPGARPGSFDRKPSFDRRPTGKFELFDVTCDKCGKACQVPFKPTGGKPIYCRECFGKDDAPRKSPRGGSSDLDEINEKLDKIMRALKID